MLEGWRLLSKDLPIEAATPVGLYLGCRHEVSSLRGPSGPVVLMTYNMEDFLEPCVLNSQEEMLGSK